LTVQVSDDGAGIDADFLPYAFDRFRQADSSTTRHHGGLGVGLAIVRHLVELHGGTAHAWSAGTGQGATFTLTLPWSARGERRATTLPPPPVATSAPAAVAQDLLAGMQLLIVDDEPDARELLAAAFGTMGATVRLAGSVAEALVEIGKSRPHALVSDVGMPAQDGYALIEKVRAEELGGGGRRRLPAIALTAYASAEDSRRAMGAGYDLHVAKPADAGGLARALVELVGPIVEAERAPASDTTVPIALAER
jgi:CheY-like chemotaxis protein